MRPFRASRYIYIYNVDIRINKAMHKKSTVKEAMSVIVSKNDIME